MSVRKDKIKEVIVVEGHHDTEKLRKYFNCETIETGGTSLPDHVMERIRKAQQTRGVIVFTDPDSPGNRIRNQINQNIPGCKNAFVMKKDAHTPKKVGVEHAGYEALKEALENVVTYEEDSYIGLTMTDMMELGLSGKEDSTQIREKIGDYFHIGNGTAKSMLRRINFAKITKEELERVIKE